MKITSSAIKSLSLSAMALAMCCNIAVSKPAYPRPITFTQPDGTEITVQKVGDERGHVLLTDDGKLLEQRNGAFYYADVDATGRLVSSNILARPQAKRSAADNAYLAGVNVDQALSRLEGARVNSRMAKTSPVRMQSAPQRGPGLFPGTAFPSAGTQKVCVVLVQYTDKQFTLDDPLDYFTRMLQQHGFNDYGGTGSAYDYFKDNSNGQFTPEFDVYGPITLAHNMAYYGGNDWSGNDQNPEQMVIEACQQLDDTVDFSQYDRDNDGYIDNVYVFYAGQGEASYGGSNTVWPHSWEVTAATWTPYYFDGVQLDRYACSNEWESARPDGIGTFVHEFSHVMGLPDLYATSYTNAFTPGAYSAMDYGPYNNDGRTPPAYGAFERYALNWMQPQVLDDRNNVTLKNVTTNTGCIIPTGKANEFFLLENRQQSGWDAYIPGHGMLIWHIDYDESTWNSNTVNNSSSHQYVDIEEADNDRNEYTRDGDTFPGASNVTSFTDDTHPSMKTWNNQRLNLPITDITETNGIIRFKVAGGLPDVNPVEITDVDNITATTADVTWTADEHATSYLVSCFTVSERDGRLVVTNVPGWARTDVGDVTSCTITGLDALTEYRVEVFSTNGVDVSEASNTVVFTTGEPTFDMFDLVAEEATDVTHNSFIAHWTGLDGALGYYIDVFTREFGDEYEEDVCDFADGVNNLPAGWGASSRLSYSSAAYSGEAAPSIRINTDQGFIQSPAYDYDIHSVSFWHRGSSTSEENFIKVIGNVNGIPQELATVYVSNEKGGTVTVIEDIPEGTRSIRLVYNEVVDKGSVAIDDIKIQYHQLITDIMVYENFSTGNVVEYEIVDLEPETEYYYSLVATDGNVMSHRSNVIKVTTTEYTGGQTSTLATVVIGTYGTNVKVTGKPYQPVNVYDTTGRLLYSGRTDGSGALSHDMRAHGIYIIKVGDKTSKIAL